MTELSFFEKLTSNLKLSKAGRVGMTLSYFGVIELLGELEALKAYIAELVVENDRLQDGWFDYETICPDGSLRPKVSDLLEDLDMKKTMISERDKALKDMLHELSRMEIAKDELEKAYMKIEDETDDLILEHGVETAKLKAKITESEKEIELCHNIIDGVLDNRFADVDDGLVENGLQHRLWELCTLYKDLQNENNDCTVHISELFDLIDCLKQLLNKGEKGA